MPDTAFTTFVAAWITTTLATTLLVAAVALSRIWDSAAYLQGLRLTLRMNM